MILLVSSWRAFFSFFALGLLQFSCFFPNQCLQAADKRALAEQEATAAVREALQREVYGLDEDRQQLLSSALATAPDLATARWHTGYVRSATGKWIQAGEQTDSQRQALLEQYQQRRLQMRDWPEEQLGLANWCAQQGLKEQEQAHLQRVVQFRPDDAAVRQRLGFVRVGSDWISRAEVQRQKAREVAAEKALVHWAPVINKLLEPLANGQAKKRAYALEQVKQIRDPAALPALESLLANRNEAMELLVVEIAAQMTDPSVAATLARHAVVSKSERVRQAAAAKLQNFDRESFVPLLIAAMYTPVESRYEAVALPNGRINYRHILAREGFTRRETLVFDTTYRRVATSDDRTRSSQLAYANAAEASRRLEQAAVQQNEATKDLNDRIGFVLCSATSTNLPAVPQDWWKWWTDQNEVFVEGRKPEATATQMVSINVADRGLKVSASSSRESLSSSLPQRQDCLVAGTPVWTEQGKVAIEQVRIGDLVLSRDVESGELAFKPVIRTTVRPAGQLVLVRAGNETFETSGGHLFWVSGQGWVKSRELASGMVLHTAAGPARVTGVNDGSHAVTYNLIVADFNTYFVGQQKLLSHDNTVRRPTNLVVPGLTSE